MQKRENGEKRENVVLTENAKIEGPVATLHPDIFVVKWRIENFASLEEKSYKSESFKMCETLWNLLIFPQCTNMDGRHVSIFLAWAPSESEKTNEFPACFEIMLENKNMSEARKKYVTHKFPPNNDHGYRDFIERASVLNASNGWIQSGILTIRITFRKIRNSVFSKAAANTSDWIHSTAVEKFSVPVEPFSLENKMESLLTAGDGDVMFIVGADRKKISAHKIIIRHFLPIPILHDAMMEGTTSEVTISDFEPEVFQAFLRFVYTGRVHEEDMSRHVFELLRLGDKYDVIRLRNLCEQHIVDMGVTPTNVCEMLLLADRHRAPNLRELCLDTFAAYQEQSTASDSFEHLPIQLIKEAVGQAPSRKRRRSRALSEREAAIDGSSSS